MVARTRKVAVEEVVETKAVEPITVEVPLTTFKKLGGGCLYLPNRIIKPNQVFTYDINQIPKSFLGSLQIMEEQRDTPAKVKVAAKYFLKEVEEGKWNVVNKAGKPINEEPLTEKDAQELKNALDS